MLRYFMLILLMESKTLGDIIFDVGSRSLLKDICFLDGESIANITCRITTATTSTVTWLKDTSTLSNCDNTADDCFPPQSISIPRYTFTSDFVQNEFYFNIAGVTFGADSGTYTCQEGSVSKDISMEVCKPPSSVNMVESGTEPTTLTCTTDCTDKEEFVTIEWFSLGGPTEESLAITATKTNNVASCNNGAVEVSSSFEHTDETHNFQEVTFRCKVSHRATAIAIFVTSTRTYRIPASLPTTTPRPCHLYMCYIGVYVAALSAVVFLVVYFIVRCPFNNLCGTDFLQKIVLSSCCCMVICIIIGVAICIPEEPDCDAGVGIAVPIVIVIILHPCVTVGVIACHIKCCMDVEASDEDGDKQNEITKDENLTTNQKNGDPTDRHKKVQASHL